MSPRERADGGVVALRVLPEGYVGAAGKEGAELQQDVVVLAGHDQNGRLHAVQVAQAVVPTERAGAGEEVQPELAPVQAEAETAEGL